MKSSRRSFIVLVAAVAALSTDIGTANVFYVTPTGAGAKTGVDWANAFDSVQDAVDALTGAGDTIYLADGTYTLANSLVVSNKASFILSGGYVGSGAPGALSGTNSVLTPGSTDLRVADINSSTMDMERVTISGASGTIVGLGMRTVDSTVALTNCAVQNNTLTYSTGNDYKGAGCYVLRGSLALIDSVVASNTIAQGSDTSDSVYGAGLYGESAAITIENTDFLENRVSVHTSTFGYEYPAWVNYYHYAYGGGVSLSSGSASFQNCRFVGDAIDLIATRRGTAYGGAIYVNNVTSLAVEGCRFEGCYAFADTSWPANYSQFPKEGGGVLYVTGSSQVAVSNSVILKSAGDVRGIGGVCLNAGALTLDNCLIASGAGSAIVQEAGTLVARQMTVADYTGWGVEQTGGTLAFTNGIVWGNGSGGMTLSGAANVVYTSSQEAQAGTGNVVTNPLFVLDYYLSSSGLTKQTKTSPCVDIGNTTAAAAGMAGRTVRTDGQVDSGTVDLGYHHSGATDSELLCLDLYVDAVSGDDGNDGTNSVSPLKTLTAALGKAVPGTTVHVATGTYSTVTGEVLPLEIPQVRMSLRGTNREATVVSAAGSSTYLMTARGVGPLTLEGMTFADVTVSNQYGNGLRVLGCNLLVTNSVLRDCSQLTGAGISRYVFGGALFAVKSNVRMVGSKVLDNRIVKGGAGGRFLFHGAGLCLWASHAVLRDSEFSGNYTYAPQVNYSYQGKGGGIYARDTSLDVRFCLFSNNTCTAYGDNPASPSFSGTARGGAVYMWNRADRGTAPSRFEDTVFVGNWAAGNHLGEGGVLYETGDNTSDQRVTFLNCVLQENAGAGAAGDVCVLNGNAAMANCLLVKGSSDGLNMQGGALAVADCTVADNGDWGIAHSGGTLAVSNSIVWGNTLGGISTTNADIGYTCIQEVHAGTSNLVQDPLHVQGYYLSVNGLPGQSADSPGIDKGSVDASVVGLDTRSTRTDSAADSGRVDLGYHYAGGAAFNPSNLTLYVDAVNGDDANTGWRADDALKTIGAGLAKAIDGSVVHIASGTYDLSLGEHFPLEIQDSNITLAGTNCTATVVDASGTTGGVLTASSKTGLSIKDITFQNGCLTNGVGAGLSLTGCGTTISNCVVRNNSILYTVQSSTQRGGGIYASAGSLSLLRSRLVGNFIGRGPGVTVGTMYGGGAYCDALTLTIDGCLFRSNYVTTTTSANYDLYGRGGGLYISGGQAAITHSAFSNNYCHMFHPRRREALGGAIYAAGVDPLQVISNTFDRNWCGPFIKQPYTPSEVGGGALYLSGDMESVIAYCAFRDNANSAASPEEGDIRVIGTTTAALTNCLIEGAASNGITAVAGSLTLMNCTVGDNGAWGVSNNAASATIKNSIVWGNPLGGIKTNGGDAITYTLSQELFGGIGNKSSDPRFVNPAANNYRLRKGSPALNAGETEPWMLTAVDLDGNDRKAGSSVDMGCYELPPPAGTVIMLR